MRVFICYRGDCDTLALSEPTRFVFVDARGRKWLCHEGDEADLDVPAMQRRQAALEQRLLERRQQGLSADTGTQTVVRCAAKEDLAVLLADEEDDPD